MNNAKLLLGYYGFKFHTFTAERFTRQGARVIVELLISGWQFYGPNESNEHCIKGNYSKEGLFSLQQLLEKIAG